MEISNSDFLSLKKVFAPVEFTEEMEGYFREVEKSRSRGL